MYLNRTDFTHEKKSVISVWVAHYENLPEMKEWIQSGSYIRTFTLVGKRAWQRCSEIEGRKS